MSNNAGALRVWWVPQVPGPCFNVEVTSPTEAKKLLAVLADYDLFQLTNRIKPDYANAGGLEVLQQDGGWEEWADEDGNEINSDDADLSNSGVAQ